MTAKQIMMMVSLNLVFTVLIVSIVITAIRNIISAAQLGVAAWVFWTRTKPAPHSVELWSRHEGLSPPITVIAPAFNEGLSITDSVRALLALEYPDHEVIVVNDGSKDDTLAKVIAAFDLMPVEREQSVVLHSTKILGTYYSPNYPNLLLIDKENGRKADAVNAGIGFATRPLVCIIDTDSIIETDGLLRAAEPFMYDNGDLIAVGGAIRIINGSIIHAGHIEKIAISPRWLPRFQIVEYMRAFLMARVANSQLGMLTLISGAFGIFKRSVLVEIGGYRHDTVGEDLELVIRMHRTMLENKRPYRIGFVPEIVCWTECPETFAGLRNQRSRWQQGGLETLQAHWRMIGNPRYGRIGIIAMPMIVIEDLLGPPCEMAGYVLVPLLWINNMISGDIAIAFLCLTFVFGTAISIGTLALEERQLHRTASAADIGRLAIASVIENFGYRQINLIYRLRGMWNYVRNNKTWEAVPRIGFDTGQATSLDKSPSLPSKDIL